MTLRGAYRGIVADDLLSVPRNLGIAPNAVLDIPTVTAATVTRFGRQAKPTNLELRNLSDSCTEPNVGTTES
jgi:hypothetical protein